VITHQHDAQIVLRSARLAGIQIDDLADRLQDLKPGDTRIIDVQASEQHPNERIRSQQVRLEIAAKELKRLELAEINQEFVQDLGFQDEQGLRNALTEQLEERLKSEVHQAMRRQVEQFLLDKVNIELPTKLSDRQEQRVVNRRAVDLMMRGLSREQVEANLEKLKGGARDEGIRELKLFFILQKVATDHNVDVDEQELNGQIAMIAIQQGRRPEKVKQEMAADGSLQNLYIRLREQKAIDKVMEQAKIEEVDVDKPQ
jgi:trigger factor